jgi:hypothetical protein
MSYAARGNMVVFVRAGEEDEPRYRAETSEDAERGAKLLNRAIYLNNVKRKYTAAARTIAEAESFLRNADDSSLGVDEGERA